MVTTARSGGCCCCAPVLGVQHAPAPSGSSCSDGNACNGVESCDGAGACRSGPSPSIDDGNPCTIDGCDPVAGVYHLPATAGTACSDGNVCNGAETCNGAGVCLPGTPLMLDDLNPCTVDTCDPVGGVSYLPAAAGTSCSDGDVCNGGETCNGGGACDAGTPLVTDDGNPCTADSCDPVVGMLHVALPGGTSCSDGDYCNGLEVCDGAATCLPGFAPSPDDDNVCTVDRCDPATGVWNDPAPQGTSCSDGDICNGAETCNGAGACVAGAQPSLDDGNACTIDACERVAGITHVPRPPVQIAATETSAAGSRRAIRLVSVFRDGRPISRTGTPARPGRAIRSRASRKFRCLPAPRALTGTSATARRRATARGGASPPPHPPPTTGTLARSTRATPSRASITHSRRRGRPAPTGTPATGPRLATEWGCTSKAPRPGSTMVTAARSTRAIPSSGSPTSASPVATRSRRIRRQWRRRSTPPP